VIVSSPSRSGGPLLPEWKGQELVGDRVIRW